MSKWMDLESIILSEVTQNSKNQIIACLVFDNNGIMAFSLFNSHLLKSSHRRQ